MSIPASSSTRAIASLTRTSLSSILLVVIAVL
jgi:hypothetical protein